MLVGLDVLKRGRNSSARRRLQDQKVGLLTHAAAVDENGEQTLKVLRELGINPTVIFSPEHGLDGLAQAEEAVGEDRADVGETRLVSLYGATKESLTPKASDLEGLDVLVIDLVDVGSRYYTYVWTALLAARAAADANVHTLVLDRPNPIGGDPSRIEGRPQDEELRSFVGLESIPIRHSMTLGEILVTQFNQEDRTLGRDGALSVVATEGWERFRQASAHGRPFVPPSPNMPTAETALVYPGGCLLEATNLSEGRGTTTPFQLIGAPYLKAQNFAEKLASLPGVWVRPTRFKPTFDKHQGSICEGIMLHVVNEAAFRPVETYLTIIAEARRQAPEEFRLLTRVYEFESEHCAFDLLTGSKQAKELLEAGAETKELTNLLCPVDEEWKIRIEAAEELLEEVRA
jgi:uncharacterized protein YbbC (DUF1343 family)